MVNTTHNVAKHWQHHCSRKSFLLTNRNLPFPWDREEGGGGTEGRREERREGGKEGGKEGVGGGTEGGGGGREGVYRKEGGGKRRKEQREMEERDKGGRKGGFLKVSVPLCCLCVQRRIGRWKLVHVWIHSMLTGYGGFHLRVTFSISWWKCCWQTMVSLLIAQKYRSWDTTISLLIWSFSTRITV